MVHLLGLLMLWIHKEVPHELLRDSNRNGWIPIPSVYLIVSKKKGLVAKKESDLLITSTISGRIGWHEALLPVNQN